MAGAGAEAGGPPPLYEVFLHADRRGAAGAAGPGSAEAEAEAAWEAGAGRRLAVAAGGTVAAVGPRGRWVGLYEERAGLDAPATLVEATAGDAFVEVGAAGDFLLLGTRLGVLQLMRAAGDLVWSLDLGAALPLQTVVATAVMTTAADAAAADAAAGGVVRVALLAASRRLFVYDVDAATGALRGSRQHSVARYHARAACLASCPRTGRLAVVGAEGAASAEAASVSVWEWEAGPPGADGADGGGGGAGGAGGGLRLVGHTHRAAGLALGFDLSKIAGGDEPRLACTGAAACFSPLGEALAVRDAGGALAAFRVRDGGVERAATPAGMRAEGVAWWGEGALAVSLPTGHLQLAAVPSLEFALAAPEKFHPGFHLAAPQRFASGKLYVLDAFTGAGGAVWRILTMVQRTPEEMMHVHVLDGDHEAALAVAAAHGIDPDAVYKGRWAASAKGAADVAESLGKVKDRAFVVAQCCSTVARTADDQRALLEYGLECTAEYEPAGPVVDDAPPAHRLLWKQRLRMLQYHDKLGALLAIGRGAYSAEAYADFRDVPAMQAAVWFARLTNFAALKVVFERCPFSLAGKPCLDVLAAVPETAKAGEYLELLQHATPAARDLPRPVDWAESRALWGEDLRDLAVTEITEGLLRGLDLAPPLAKADVGAWCLERARAILQYGSLAGALEFGAAVLAERPGEGMDALVQRCKEIRNAEDYGCAEAVQALAYLEMAEPLQLEALLNLTTPEDLAEHLQVAGTFFFNNRGAGPDRMVATLQDVAARRCKADPEWACALLAAASSEGTLPCYEPAAVAEIAVECVKRSERFADAPPVERLLADLTRKCGELPPAQSRGVVEALKVSSDLALARKLLLRLKVGLTLEEIQAVTDAGEQKVVLRRIVSKAAATTSGSAHWARLWRDLCQFQRVALTGLEREGILEEICRVLLHEGTFNLAQSFMAGMDSVRLGDGTAERLVIAAARDLFYSAPSMSSAAVDKARKCLMLLPHSDAIQHELDVINASKQLPSMGVEIRPAQMKRMGNKLEVVEGILDRHPNPSKDLRRIVGLAESLGLQSPEEMHQVRLLLAQRAHQDGDLAVAERLVDVLVREDYAPAWETAYQLACHGKGLAADLQERFMAFAISYCPEDALVPMLGGLKLLQEKQRGQEAAADADAAAAWVQEMLSNPLVWVEDVEAVAVRLHDFDLQGIARIQERLLEGARDPALRERIALLLLGYACLTVSSSADFLRAPYTLYTSRVASAPEREGLIEALHREMLAAGDLKALARLGPDPGAGVAERFRRAAAHLVNGDDAALQVRVLACLYELADGFGVERWALAQAFLQGAFERRADRAGVEALVEAVRPELEADAAATLRFLWGAVYPAIADADAGRFRAFCAVAGQFAGEGGRAVDGVPAALDAPLLRKWQGICDTLADADVAAFSLKRLFAVDVAGAVGDGAGGAVELLALSRGMQSEDELETLGGLLEELSVKEPAEPARLLNHSGLLAFDLLDRVARRVRDGASAAAGTDPAPDLAEFAGVLRPRLGRMAPAHVRDVVEYLVFGRELRCGAVLAAAGAALPATLAAAFPGRLALLGAVCDDPAYGPLEAVHGGGWAQYLNFLRISELCFRQRILPASLVPEVNAVQSLPEDVGALFLGKLAEGGSVAPLVAYRSLLAPLYADEGAAVREGWEEALNFPEYLANMAEAALEEMRAGDAAEAAADALGALTDLVKALEGADLPDVPVLDREAVAASVDAMREGLWNQLDAFGGEDGDAPQDAKMEILSVLQEIREGYFWADWEPPAAAQTSPHNMILYQSVAIMGDAFKDRVALEHFADLALAGRLVADLVREAGEEDDFLKLVQLLELWDVHWADEARQAGGGGARPLSALHAGWAALLCRLVACGNEAFLLYLLDGQAANEDACVLDADGAAALLAAAAAAAGSAAHLPLKLRLLLRLPPDDEAEAEAEGGGGGALPLDVDLLQLALHRGRLPLTPAFIADLAAFCGAREGDGLLHGLVLPLVVAGLAGERWYYAAGELLFDALPSLESARTVDGVLAGLELFLEERAAAGAGGLDAAAAASAVPKVAEALAGRVEGACAGAREELARALEGP